LFIRAAKQKKHLDVAIFMARRFFFVLGGGKQRMFVSGVSLRCDRDDLHPPLTASRQPWAVLTNGSAASVACASAWVMSWSFKVVVVVAMVRRRRQTNRNKKKKREPAA
jgi:hypothetical protein